LKAPARAAGKGGAPAKTADGESGLLGGWSAAGTGRPRKHSLTIAGHRTAVSLEEPFWEALRLAADRLEVPLARLVAEIDAVRGQTSLSSAIRLFVLNDRSRR
jgi:predicted DNA-binding ribbon-helix-helix protein